ncbi:MAG: glycosyltransferase [Pseudomonadota bacterium]
MTIPHILLANVFFAPFSYGGATIVAEQVSKQLVSRGTARISAVSLISRKELTPYSVIRSQVGPIDNYLINMPQGRKYTQFYDNPDVGRVFADLMRDLQPDLLHAHCIQEVGVDVLRVARVAGVPSILSVHDFWWICERQFMVRMDQRYCGQDPVKIEACKGCVGNWRAARRRFDVLSETASLVDMVTYPSAFARNLCEASGLAPGKGVVWENGVHLPGPDFAQAQARRRARDPRLVFGFVGGPSQIKGWPIMRDAFKRLKRKDFRVHLVEGSLDGSWWRDQRLTDLPGDWSVVPRYSQENMDDFYVGIDVLLFLSQWKETFGLAIREALARNIHVIQTDSGGTTEHNAIDRKDLIPIRSDPNVVRDHLERALVAHPDYRPSRVMPIGFDDQTAQFETLMETVLSDTRHTSRAG